MSSEDEKKQQAGQSGPQGIKITVDRSVEIEALQKELDKITEESRQNKVKAESLLKEKTDLEKEKTDLRTEKETLESNLTQIAEKEYQKKKEAIMARVKANFNPEDRRYKEIEAKLTDPEKGPENLKEVEYTMSILEEAMAKSKAEIEAMQKRAEDEKKAQEERLKKQDASATAPLNDPQTTGGTKPTTPEEGYDSYEAMISDLVVRARDTRDPVKQAEAEAILKEFWTKWSKQVKKDFTERTAASQIQYESKEKEHHGVNR